MRRVEVGVFESCEDFVLFEVFFEGLAGDVGYYFAEQMETQVGILELSAYWKVWFGKSDILPYIFSCFGERSRIVVLQT